MVSLHSNFRAAPLPLDLCYVPGFDLINNTRLCPPERNALKEFYASTKGGEWTDSVNWTHQYYDHCSWHGVTCRDEAVTELILANNGLSGKLNKRVAELHSLEVLDLNDNDIKVCSVSAEYFVSCWNTTSSHVPNISYFLVFIRALFLRKLESSSISPICGSVLIHSWR